ncbi:hypothetical protein N0V90_010728 [Kalmusia sp. IMI 367209]|nr:hypothetical protein N0V90_010728 [Kalmusia sp. IMI 367209]
MVRNTRATAALEKPKVDEKADSDDKPERSKGKKEHIRKKAWRPKTKTGCVTCRIRRIKCDEAKPSCQRCTSTGRKCDGYKASAPTAQSHGVVYSPPQLLLNPNIGLDLNSTEESEAFHFFKYQTAYELSGFFDSTFWQFEVLQASHTIPAIRHAVIAIAALHRKFITGRMPVVPDDMSDKQILFAIEQSNRAIRELTKSSAQRTVSDMMDVMTACIMFYCLCCFQGHQSDALEHLHSGLKILHQLDRDFDRQTDDLEVHPVSLKTLRTIFVTMDVQARGVMSKEMLETWAKRPKRNFNRPPSSFVTFSQARYAFEAVYHEMMGFMQALDVDPPTRPDAAEWICGEYQQFQREFDALSILLDQFLARLSNVTAQEDRESILGIKLFREQIRVYLRLFKGFDSAKRTREIEWCVEEQDMRVMLDLACELLRAPSDISVPAGARPEDYYPDVTDPEFASKMEIPAYSRPIFSSNSGMLSALWLVVSKSKSSALRRRAIALMLDFPRREGIWDGVVAGRIAWEILRLEEAAVDGVLGVDVEQRVETIADCNKVRDCAIRYVAPRVMEVEFRSLKQWEAGPDARGVKKIIAW